MTQERTVVVEKEFSAELAGERVGWIAVHGAPTTSPDLKLVTIGAATVGPNGARLEHYEYGGQRLYSDRRDEGGFMHGASLYMPIEPGERVHREGISGRFHYEDGSTLAYMRNGSYRHVEPEDRQWADRQVDFLDTIKRVLDENDIIEFYPDVYYNLNGIAAHQSHRESLDVDPAEILLADPDMRERTAEQIKLAKQIERHMSMADAFDASMLRRLTVFSDTAPEDIPTVFAASRQAVTESEESMLRLRSDLYARDGIYTPPGIRRTWPYMDPLPRGEDTGYGPELEGLKKGSISKAQFELELERRELQHRLKFLHRGVATLETLNQLEAAK